MENYRKAAVVEQPCPCPFTELLHDGTPVVRVRDGSKIRNLMRFAQNQMESHSEKVQERVGAPEELAPSTRSQACRQVVFTGVGPSVSKAISCVEIMKRRSSELHQVTRLVYASLKETWDPLEPSAGLDSITVTRNVPSIWVLLSRDPLDSTTSGYQAPGNFNALWVQAGTKDGRENPRRKNGDRGPRRQTKRPRDERKTSGQASGVH